LKELRGDKAGNFDFDLAGVNLLKLLLGTPGYLIQNCLLKSAIPALPLKWIDYVLVAFALFVGRAFTYTLRVLW
jgi:hypothetical protein